MKGRFYPRWAVRMSIVALLLLGMAFVPVTRLHLTAGQHQCWLPGDQFSLRWRHSVEHQLWQEHYRREGQQLLLDATYLQTFGAGTPSHGAYIPAPEGFVGFKKDIFLPAINWMVSRNMQGVILTTRGQIPINQEIPNYTPVQIVPKRTFLYTYLAGFCR